MLEEYLSLASLAPTRLPKLSLAVISSLKWAPIKVSTSLLRNELNRMRYEPVIPGTIGEASCDGRKILLQICLSYDCDIGLLSNCILTVRRYSLNFYWQHYHNQDCRCVLPDKMLRCTDKVLMRMQQLVTAGASSTRIHKLSHSRLEMTRTS